MPEAELPVRLPDVERYAPTGTGESPLAAIDAWVERTCPMCGGPAQRETNTMPQWAGSCWYYLRYLDPQNADARLRSAGVEKEWMPVDLYVGGAEHAVLHLLYARFWHKVLFDMGLVHTKEPFQKLRHQGTVLAYTYQDGRAATTSRRGRVRGDTPTLRATGEELKQTVEKMAKSKLNGVNPDDVIGEYGADVMRLYEMFMGEFELPKPWDPRAIEG